MVSAKQPKEEREACTPLLVHGPLLLLTSEAAATIKQQWQLNSVSAISPSQDFFFSPLQCCNSRTWLHYSICINAQGQVLQHMTE